MEVSCPNCKNNIKVPSPQKDDSQIGFTPLENDNNSFTSLEKHNGGFAPLEAANKSFNNSASQPVREDSLIYIARQRLTECLERAQTMQATSDLASKIALDSDNVFFAILGMLSSLFAWFKSKTAAEDVIAFNSVRQNDIPYIEQLDLLPYVGKKASQLIAKPHTFYAPAVMSSDCAFIFAGDERDFIYSAEEITKIYIFENQLIQAHAIWDYTTGTLFNEQFEAFFFKDITDISTEYGYEKIKEQDQEKMSGGTLLLLLICIVLICTVYLAIFGILGIAIIIITKKKEQKKNKKYYVRKSETFRITSTSGRSMEMSALCSEWIKAKKGKFEQRTSNEKIYHAIRKMIEEKKAQLANG